jgi:hypothetical protein
VEAHAQLFRITHSPRRILAGTFQRFLAKDVLRAGSFPEPLLEFTAIGHEISPVRRTELSNSLQNVSFLIFPEKRVYPLKALLKGSPKTSLSLRGPLMGKASNRSDFGTEGNEGNEGPNDFAPRVAFVPSVNFGSIHRFGVPIRLLSISVICVISGQNSDGCDSVARGAR